VPLEEDVLPDPEELPLLLEDPEEGDPALPLSFLAVPFAMVTYAYHREKGPCCTCTCTRHQTSMRPGRRRWHRQLHEEILRNDGAFYLHLYIAASQTNVLCHTKEFHAPREFSGRF
jgi:hypothetical protein